MALYVHGFWGSTNTNLQRGFSVLPKSVKPSRIQSNFQVFDLDDERQDMNLSNYQSSEYAKIRIAMKH